MVFGQKFGISKIAHVMRTRFKDVEAPLEGTWALCATCQNQKLERSAGYRNEADAEAAKRPVIGESNGG
mgnify:CR=1 FL=1